MPLQNITFQAFGVLGNNQPIGTSLAVISDLVKGRYRIWGTVTHTVAGGVRLIILNQANFVIANAADSATNFATQPFGDIVQDLLQTSNTIRLELEQATGQSGNASGNLYVQRLTP